jgi:hypothetical protein
MIDVLELLPASHPRRAALAGYLRPADAFARTTSTAPAPF